MRIKIFALRHWLHVPIMMSFFCNLKIFLYRCKIMNLPYFWTNIWIVFFYKFIHSFTLYVSLNTYSYRNYRIKFIWERWKMYPSIREEPVRMWIGSKYFRLKTWTWDLLHCLMLNHHMHFVWSLKLPRRISYYNAQLITSMPKFHCL